MHQDVLNFHICSVLHPHETCLQHWVSFAIAGFKRALPLYAPLHIVTTVVVLLAKLTSKVKERVKRAGSFANLSRSFSLNDFIEPEQAALVATTEQGNNPGQATTGTCDNNPDGGDHARRLLAREEQDPLHRALAKANLFLSRCLRLFTKRRMLRIASYTLSLVQRVVFNILRSSVFLGVYCSSKPIHAALAEGPAWLAAILFCSFINSLRCC